MILLKQPEWLKALRRTARLKPARGCLSNIQALEVLYLHFVEGWSKESILMAFTTEPKQVSTVEKLLATNEGEQSSRRPDVRRIFGEYMQETGRVSPFNYDHPGQREREQASRRAARANRPGVTPLLDQLAKIGKGKNKRNKPHKANPKQRRS